MTVHCVISIPSAPPVVPATAANTPSPHPAAATSRDANLSFLASFLKSLTKQQDDEKPVVVAKLSMGGKDKQQKKNAEDGKEKSLVDGTTIPTAVPVPVVPAPEVKPLQLGWPPVKTASGSDEHNATPAAATVLDGVPAQEMKTDDLKNSLAEARANAPVAFGVNLSNANLSDGKGAKIVTAKPDATKTSEPHAKSATPDTGKPAAQVPKAAETKTASGNEHRQHADSSRDEQPPAESPAAVKASPSSSARQHTEPAPAIHATAPATEQAPVAAAVQNAYASTPAAAVVNKPATAAPVAAPTAVVEPPAASVPRPQNIDLKIGGSDNSQVDVRISQRAGDVQVTVRTPDGDLAQSLRQHLPELSDRLSQTGVSGDVWQPASPQATNTGANDSGSRYSDDAQTQQQAQHQSHGNSHHSGQQQEHERQQPAWLDEMNQAEKESI